MTKTSIGTRIKKFRELREVSLEELSNRSGLNLEIITAIEENKVYPALGILLKISRALGTRLGTFIDDQITQDPVIVKKEELGFEPTITQDKQHLPLKFYSLGKGKTDRHMEPFYIEIYPQSKDVEFSSHEGEEFIVVLSGEVEITYGKNKYILKQGDSIYYNSVVPHKVCCANNEIAKIYAVLYMP